MLKFLQRIPFQKFLLNIVERRIQLKAHATVQTPTSVSPPGIKIKSGYFGNENVVITGGARGLGKALAVKLAKLDANVVIWDDDGRDLDETTTMVKQTGGSIRGYLCDMTHKDNIYTMADETVRDVGQITMVINSAEVATEKLLLDTPDSLIQKAFNINVLSMFWTTKAFLPSMIDGNKGHIVTISSMAGHMGIQKLTDYCATKAAVTGFMTALKTELEREGSTGVKTTIVCPYFINDGQSSVKLRFIQPLDVDQVAERTIEAIRKRKEVVFLPGWFKYALIPRWITPGIISSLLLKLLIKDLKPKQVETHPTKMGQLVKYLGPIEPAGPQPDANDVIQNLKEKQQNDDYYRDNIISVTEASNKRSHT